MIHVGDFPVTSRRLIRKLSRDVSSGSFGGIRRNGIWAYEGPKSPSKVPEAEPRSLGALSLEVRYTKTILQLANEHSKQHRENASKLDKPIQLTLQIRAPTPPHSKKLFRIFANWSLEDRPPPRYRLYRLGITCSSLLPVSTGLRQYISHCTLHCTLHFHRTSST